jgi:aminoglycoside phosphotransferase
MTRDGIIRHWAIFDGRSCTGVVDLDSAGEFVARDVAGKEVGRFKDLAAAAAAFDFNPEETT